MGMRIKLTCTAGTSSESIWIRNARPPFLLVADNPSDASWTGSVILQQSMQTQPAPNNGGGVSNSGVTDANVTDWMTVATLATGTMANWDAPLVRVRANGGSVTGTGTAKLYIIEQVHTLDPAQDK